MPRKQWDLLEIRRSYKYRLGWAGEDLWSPPIGRYRSLKAGQQHWDREGEGYTRAVWLTVRSKAPIKEVKRAIADVLRWECRCAHDCCGHTFCHYVDVRRMKRREYLAILHVGINC